MSTAKTRRSARFLNTTSLGSVFINTIVRPKMLNPFTGRMVLADGKTGKYVKRYLSNPQTHTPRVKRYSLNRKGKVVKTRPNIFNRITSRWNYVKPMIMSLSCLMVLHCHTVLNADVCAKIATFCYG